MIGVFLATFSAFSIILSGPLDMPLVSLIGRFMLAVFAFYHSYFLYGLKKSLIFLALVCVISWSYETTSILTGFPFGNYHYHESFYGPWIGLVPFMIMPAYYSMGYCAWIIANILLDRRESSVKGVDVILLPLIASFVMVSWDMSMDPQVATVRQAWIWHDGGAYFGVPFVNFCGWFLCVFTFYVIFSFIQSSGASAASNVRILNKTFWMLPVALYVSRTVPYIINALTVENRQIADPSGQTWWTADITHSLLLVSFFTMMFLSLYAIIRIYRHPITQ